MSVKITTLFDPFDSDKRLEMEVEPGKSLRELYAGLNPKFDISHCRCQIDGAIITDFDSVPPDGTEVVIKIVPEGDGGGMKAVGIAVTMLGVVIAGVAGWTGIGAIVGAGLIGVGLSLAGNGLYMLLYEPPSIKNNAPETRPGIKGAKNQARHYGYVPVLFGRHLITPDLAAAPYITNANNEQYLTQLFCCGYDNVDIETASFKLGDTKLVELSKTKDIDRILSGADPVIHMEILAGNQSSIYPQRVKPIEVSRELKQTLDDGTSGAIVVTTPDNTSRIDINFSFPNGLFGLNNDGDVITIGIYLDLWIKAADASDEAYTRFGYVVPDSGNLISASNKKALYYAFSKNVASGAWSIKIEKSGDSGGGKYRYDSGYVLTVNAFQDGPPVSLDIIQSLRLIALKVKATDRLNGVVDNFNFIAQAVLPAYNMIGSGPAAWETPEPTKNPAAALLYALRGGINRRPVDDAFIDWRTIEDWYTWCEVHQYYCSAVLSDKITLMELLKQICLTGRADPAKRDGLFSVIQDVARNSHVQLLTPKNTIDYSQSLEFPDIPQAVEIQFIDEASGFQEDVRKVYNTPSGEQEDSDPSDFQEMRLWGVTDARQAFLMGRYNYACLKNRPRIHNIVLDIEYLTSRKGSWVKYSGDTALAGIAWGRIKDFVQIENFITALTLDEMVQMEEGKNYRIRIRTAQNQQAEYGVVCAPEYTNQIFLEDTIPVSFGAAVGDLYAFGEVGSVTLDLLIADIDPISDSQARLICTDYAPEIFGVDDPDYIYPPWDPNVSVGGVVDSGVPQAPPPAYLNDIREKIVETQESLGEMAAGSAGLIPDDITGLVAVVSRDAVIIRWHALGEGLRNVIQNIAIEIQKEVDGDWITINASGTEYLYPIDRVVDGYPEAAYFAPWRIRAKAENVYGKQSLAYAGGDSGISLNVSKYGTWIPATPSAIVARAEKDGIRISITHSKQTGYYGDIEFFPNIEYLEEPRQTSPTKDPQYFYPFDRGIDGYPEKSDVPGSSTSLGNYAIQIRVTDPISGNFIVSDPVAVDESGYGTWIPSIPSAAAKAEETGIRINITHTKQPGYYGEVEFYPIIKYGEEQRPAAYTKEPEYFYRFDRFVDGYPERSTVTGDYPSLGNYTVQIQVTDPVSGNSALSAAFAVSEGSYGTWIPAAPSNVAAVAEETGLRITYGHPAAGLYGDVLFIPIITCDEEDRPASDTRDKNYFYRFDRTIDGYPEKSDVAGDCPSLGNYAIQIQVLNTASGYTALSAQVTVDESLYKTWIPVTPAPAFSASGRTIAIAWRPPNNAYGTIGYDIQVAKQYQVDGSDDITDRTDPGAWFAPAANDSLIYALGDTYAALLAENDPANIGYAYHYGDLQVAWHTDAASRRIHGTAFTAMVPLDQQTVTITKTNEEGTPEEALGNSAKNTTYYFRLRAVNLETGRMGAYSGDDGLGEAVTSCAVNAQDVVANAINTAAVVPGSITAEKMFVKELAAISANMGVITDGALAGDAFNYWALSMILGQNGQIKYYPGEMRVGGSDQYFRVLPIVKDGILLDYHVEFKAGSFTVESNLSKISGEVIVTLNDNALDRTRITPKGTFYEHRSTTESEWSVIAQMTTAGVKSRNLYSDDSIVITNSQITDRRKNGSDIGLPYLTPASEVYHFDTDFNNQRGLSTIDIDYDGAQPTLVDETDNNDAIDFSTAILAVSPYSEIGKSIYGQFLLTCVFNSNVFTTEFWLKYVWNENQILFSIGNIKDTIVLQLLNDEPYYNDVFDDDIPYNAEVLESDQLVYNDIQYAHGELVHQWQGGSETIDLDSLDIKFEEERWYHLAVAQTATTLSLYINKIKVDFARKSSGQSQISVNINESKGSVIIDELMIDKTAALPFDDFSDNTVNKIPYAALDANDNWLVMEAQTPNKVKMNWLSSDVFRDAVLAIVQGQ